MEFGKKLLIGALTLLVGAGGGEYALYKKFEQSPNPIREILRWPYNRVWTECDRLSEQFLALNEIKLNKVSGKLTSLECVQGKAINFVQMDNGQRFAYTGDFFAGINDVIELRVLLVRDLKRMNKFEEGVHNFRSQNPNWLWATRGYGFPSSDFPNTHKLVESIPLTKLRHLDGIVEDYQIIGSN